MEPHAGWRIAYAKQAKADLRTRDALLRHPDLPECQQLHFLQMACEKVCKAHLCGRGTDPTTLQSSHVYIAATLPVIVRQQFAMRSTHTQKDRSWMIEAIRKLARQIELFAPAVKAGGTVPANCEYPWIGHDGAVMIPAEHSFRLDLLHAPAGRQLIKSLWTAVDNLMEK